MFLDGVYGVKDNVSAINSTIESPVTQSWLNNKATGSNNTTKFNIQMAGVSKILYR